MNLFTKPTRVEASDVLHSTIAVLLGCFLAPTSIFERQNMNWVGGLVIVFPVFFVAGWFACQRDNAFYIRACWALMSGAVVWPLCLLFRPVSFNLAFVMMTFGAGPVAAFHVRRRLTHPR